MENSVISVMPIVSAAVVVATRCGLRRALAVASRAVTLVSRLGSHPRKAMTGGAITGDAPLFDRFILGNSSTLQGWNRYEIDPLGGTRIVHNQVTYGYRVGEGTVEAFYDTGAIWQPGAQIQADKARTVRHALGAGYKQGAFVVAMAFPVRDGRMEPVFMAGMNY